MGAYRFTPTHNLPSKLKKIDPQQFKVLSGSKYYDKKLGLNFPTRPVTLGATTLPGIDPDGAYRTRFSGVAHNGIIHCNSNWTLNIAFQQRMLVERTDENGVSIHQELLDAQNLFLNSPHQLYEILERRFALVFEEWEGREEAARLKHDEPHAKKALRIQGYQDRLSNHGERLWLRRQRLKYKLKRDEIGKPGKPGRTIGDLGVEASLQGAWATKLDKEAVAEDIILDSNGRRTRVHFCSSPTSAELQQVFDHLQYPPEDAYFVYFSDDSCYATHTPNGVWRANLDISSCDASHSDELFVKYVNLHPEGQAREDLQILADQCRAPIAIEAPSRHEGKKCRVLLQSPGARLFSGSTLTTVINGFANTCIAQAIHSSACTTAASIETAALQAGYVLTIDVCEEFEDIQFLKSSPVVDITGRYRPVLNIGVLLRAYGTCKGDLPRGPRGSSLQSRADSFQKGLLQGLYPTISFPFLESLKKRYSHALDGKFDASSYEHKCTDTVAVFTDDAIFKRYYLTTPTKVARGFRMSGVNMGGLTELADCEFGFEHASLGANAILRKDYGLSCW